MTYFFQDGGKHNFEENLTLDGSRFQVFGSGFFLANGCPFGVSSSRSHNERCLLRISCAALPPPRKPQDHRWHRGSTTNLAGFSRRNYLKLHTDPSLVKHYEWDKKYQKMRTSRMASQQKTIWRNAHHTSWIFQLQSPLPDFSNFAAPEFRAPFKSLGSRKVPKMLGTWVTTWELITSPCC